MIDPERSAFSYPNIAQAFGIWGLYIVFALAIGLSVGFLSEVTGLLNTSWQTAVAYSIAGLLILWFAYSMKKSKEKPKKVFLFRQVPFLAYLILFIITICVGVILDPLTNLIPMPDLIKELFATLGKRDLPTFLTVVIAGPVLEELLFRGIVLDGFLKTYSPVKSIIWSSIIFSLFHLNPWQAIPAFLIGLLLGYVYWKTQSLLPCIFIHFINNFISWLIGIIVTEDIYTLSELITNRTHYFLVLAGSALILIPAFRTLIRTLKPSYPHGSDS